MYNINWYESYRDLGRKLTEKKREAKRLEQENATLHHENSKLNDELSATRQQRDKLLAALEAVREGSKSYQREKLDVAMRLVEAAIASVEAADAAPD